MKILLLTLFTFVILQTANSQTVIVNPDGTHSVSASHGAHSVVINPDGTHSIGVKHGLHTIVIKPEGTHSVGVQHGIHTINVDPASGKLMHTDFLRGDTGEEDMLCVETDSLFLKGSTFMEDEQYKLRVLKMLRIINRKEYKELKNRNKITPTYYLGNRANRLYDLGCSFELNEIDKDTFKRNKRDIIYTDSSLDLGD